MPRLSIAQPVWLIVTEVRVTGNAIQPWREGSKALVQAFVPSPVLEDALTLLDAYLPTQELERIDVMKAERYVPDEEWEELPAAHILEPLEKAARTNECQLGVFVVSQETAWPR